VARIEPDVLQKLLVEVEKLETTCALSARDRLQRAKIDEAKASVINGAARFDGARWAQLGEQEQQELQEKLMTMRDTLMEVSRNGNDKIPPSFSAGDSASPKSIIWLTIFGLIFAATLLSLIR
jgi:hypothetical protein